MVDGWRRYIVHILKDALIVLKQPNIKSLNIKNNMLNQFGSNEKVVPPLFKKYRYDGKFPLSFVFQSLPVIQLISALTPCHH